MPNPKSNGKAKSKKKPCPCFACNSTPEEFLQSMLKEDINTEHGWNMVASNMCLAYGLPDLTSRAGFRQLHVEFDKIYALLDQVLRCKPDDIKTRGGIIRIYSMMAADAVLLQKLLKKGLLQQLISLLDVPEARFVAVRGLDHIAKHGSLEIHAEIAKHTNALLRLMQTYRDEKGVVPYCVNVILITVRASCDGEEAPNRPDVLAKIDFPLLIRTFLDATRRLPPVVDDMAHYTVHLFSAAIMHVSQPFLENPESLDFLIAALRAKDWSIKCNALGALFRLYILGDEGDPRTVDPMIFLNAIGRPAPPHLSAILDKDPERSDVMLRAKTMTEYFQLMDRYTSAGDLYDVGLALARLIPRTEHSITPTRSTRPPSGPTPPLPSLRDAMPDCAKRIRARGQQTSDRALLDAADMLEIKHNLMNYGLQEGIRIAKNALERSPDRAYFHYVICLSRDWQEALRAAKRGIKCADATYFLRTAMLHRAVAHAGDTALRIFQVENPAPGSKRWEEALAFLMSATNDAQKFVSEACPDHKHMKEVVQWHIMLQILTRDEISLSLQELQGALDLSRLADEFQQHYDQKVIKLQLRDTAQLIVKRYAGAIKTFAPVFENLYTTSDTPNASLNKQDLKERLDDWVSVSTPVDTVKQHAEAVRKYLTSKARFANVTLYRCSWCAMPSALLKKCSRCQKTRYCDAKCQKAHWAEHKPDCGKAAT